MRICAMLLLLGGLISSAGTGLMALDALTYGTEAGVLSFFAPFAEAFVRVFLSEGGVIFWFLFVLLAFVTALVNLRNKAVPPAVRILIPICFVGAGALVVAGAQQSVGFYDIGATAKIVFVAGLLVNAAYIVLLIVNTVKTYKKAK